MSVGDKSFHDVLVNLFGQNLERLPEEHKEQLINELIDIVNLGGCFEDEGFLTLKCEMQPFVIKPYTWFRSREEVARLLLCCT